MEQRKKKLSEKERLKDFIYELAYDLSANTGISFSETLGHYLGVKDPTYGWESSLSVEEFESLFDRQLEQPQESADYDMPF